MGFKDICKGDGECLSGWQYAENIFHTKNDWICDHKCKPEKCVYHIICNNIAPEWILNDHDKMCIYCHVNGLECKTNSSEVLIYKNKECPVCLEKKDCVQYIKCNHHICVGCYKTCFKEYDENEPKFPYSDEVYDNYYHKVKKELRYTFNKDYPLIEKYESDWDDWYEGVQEKYNNAANLRKCPLCRL